MRIVVGITGGIAAYKAVTLVRLLTEAGHDVKVIPTANALRFIGSATLEAISHNTVDPDLYTDVADVKHIELAQSAELIIVAPATGSFLARTAAGIADDLLSNVVLATSAPIVIAPAMHTEMWTNAATQQNVKTLRSRHITVIEPAIGRLTGNDSGAGRLPEPEEIVQVALALAGPKDLAGYSFVVTAGGTHEPIDPVRFLGNMSSGKQGLAIARAAYARGANVRLIAANFLANEAFEVVTVSTSQEMAEALASVTSDIDCLVMAAAIGDFRAESVSDQKLKKTPGGEGLTLNLVRTPDLLAETTSRLRNQSAQTIVVGFAAETVESADDLAARAFEKLQRKASDLVVGNDVSNGLVFGVDETNVVIVEQHENPQFESGTKVSVANVLLDRIGELLAKR
jgi:phosphopantothenoylcysteine decarboxylase/phosphopantothenate--cysteine ligase